MSAPIPHHVLEHVADLQREIARLRSTLEAIVDMNVQYAVDKYGDASKADTMACVVAARTALGTQMPEAGQ